MLKEEVVEVVKVESTDGTEYIKTEDNSIKEITDEANRHSSNSRQISTSNQ